MRGRKANGHSRSRGAAAGARITALVGGAAALPHALQPDAVVLLEGGRVLAAGPRAATPIPRGASRVDARGCVVVPGLVDLHINGFGGVDAFSAGPKELARMGATLASTGVTSFVPTLVTSPFPSLCRSLARLAGAVSLPSVPGCAEAVGLYVEGPFLSESKRGAHPSQDLRQPRAESVKQLAEILGRGPSIVALAPELPGALDAIRTFTAGGAVVALAHSNADAETCRQAEAAGARHVVHLFNAMAPMHHRNPGLAGFALGTSEVTAEVIADGHHVDRWMIAAAWRALGAERMCLVSDALAPAGLPLADGTTVRLDSGLGKVTLKRGSGDPIQPLRAGASPMPRFVNASGVLAGAAVSLSDCLRFAVHGAAIPLFDAVRMATSTPARVLGLSSRKGQLAPGFDADVLLLDGELRPRTVWVRGKLVEPGRPADETKRAPGSRRLMRRPLRRTAASRRR